MHIRAAHSHFFLEMRMVLHETNAEDMEWSDFSVTLFKGHLKVMVEGEKAEE